MKTPVVEWSEIENPNRNSDLLSIMASDLGWQAGEWKEWLDVYKEGLQFRFRRWAADYYGQGEDRELAGYIYKGPNGQTLMIFND
jgi:3-phenylpropionate/cinnamic acid dioxygenase small subunit